MSFTITLDVRDCEAKVKSIFAKELITDEDVKIANVYINKWKILTGWVERTELPIIPK